MKLQKQAGGGGGVDIVGVTERSGEGDQGLRGGVKVGRVAQTAQQETDGRQQGGQAQYKTALFSGPRL
jgi:hypothetical protein